MNFFYNNLSIIIKPRMPKIAWARKVYNAYHNIKTGEEVYRQNGELLGTSDGFKARPTDKSPGSICLMRKGKFIWISGDVEKNNNCWYLTESCKVS